MSGSMSGVWRRGHGRTSKAPPDERGGNRYVRPTTTAPHLDSTDYGPTGLAARPGLQSESNFPFRCYRLPTSASNPGLVHSWCKLTGRSVPKALKALNELLADGRSYDAPATETSRGQINQHFQKFDQPGTWRLAPRVRQSRINGRATPILSAVTAVLSTLVSNVPAA
jgi:hypothetical protein